MKKYNFSAGPATLPQEVLKEVKEELLDYNKLGYSVLEMSHRSKDFESIIEGAKDEIRKLANIGPDYDVLFLQGGASSQFAMVPMNLMVNGKADYLVTGNWAKKAYEEALKFGDIKVLKSSEKDNFTYIPDLTDLDIRDDSDYIYMTENNTIYGTEYKEIPDVKGKILVNDASSNIFSRPMDINKFGLVFAGAQKNLGPAGVTLVIVRKDLVGKKDMSNYPTMFNYEIHANKKSMYNTPPTFSIYVLGKVVKWINDLGGLEKIGDHNSRKADLIYDFLDQSKIFVPVARKDSRSRMNVVFKTESSELDSEFIDLAAREGLVGLKGYRSLGGMRASIYNAMPYEGVKKLVDFMEDFERKRIG